MFLRMNEGILIAIEGPDGVGTTSVAAELLNKLGEGIPERQWTVTQEPSKGPVGNYIRRFLDKTLREIPPRAMELLFRADRIDHDQTIIRPYLNKGVNVITDRHYVSTLVYQTVAKIDWELGVEEPRFDVMAEMGRMFNAFRLGDKIQIPHLTILLRANLETMAKRRGKRGTDEELYEKSEFQRRVDQLYGWWFQDSRFDVGRRKLVCAERPLEEVVDKCFNAIEEILNGEPRQI